MDSVLGRLGVDAKEGQLESQLGVLQALARGDVDLEQAQARLGA
jgi:hypothetical protein